MESTIAKKLYQLKKAGITLKRDTKAFNYQYATLGQIQEKLGKTLDDLGLVITHSIKENNVRTEIIEIETAESVSSSIPMSEGIKAQDKGSEITYFRRYNLLCLLDLEVEDDDGKKASEGFDNKKTSPKEEDDKAWFNQPQLDAMIANKGTFTDENDAVKKARLKYKVSKEMEQNIREIFD